VTHCPNCGMAFDATAHQEREGFTHCPGCDHEFLAGLGGSDGEVAEPSAEIDTSPEISLGQFS
jgi:uncharacterized Zn finger protein (UPF0148 family)